MVVHGIDTSRVKASVFDLGGVILAGGPEAVRRFGEERGIDVNVWGVLRQKLFSENGPWAEVERGERSLDDFASLLRDTMREAGAEVDLEQARRFMGNGDPTSEMSRIRSEIVGAIAAIRRRMPTALLTNNVAEWRSAWRAMLDVDALFDVVVDSSEVGTRKPERRIYEITQARLGVDHGGIFFVDDLGINLKSARALGWQTLKYVDTAVVLEVLERLV